MSGEGNKVTSSSVTTMVPFGSATAFDDHDDCHEAADFAGEDVGALTQMIKDVVAGKTKHKSKITVSDADAADIAAYWAAG